jgi:hypothetical protein
VSLNRFHTIALAGWSALVLGSLSVRVTTAAGPLSWPEVLAWVALMGFPAITLLGAFRGAPPPTIAQILYDTEHPAGGSDRTETPTDGRS